MRRNDRYDIKDQLWQHFPNKNASVSSDIASAPRLPERRIDVKTVSPELLAAQKLPEEFRQAFLNGSLYERISIRTSDDPIKTYYSFDTEPEDEFDEYTHPSIRITLTGKTS